MTSPSETSAATSFSSLLPSPSTSMPVSSASDASPSTDLFHFCFGWWSWCFTLTCTSWHSSLSSTQHSGSSQHFSVYSVWQACSYSVPQTSEYSVEHSRDDSVWQASRGWSQH